MKLPSDNDLVGDPGPDDELSELQQMVRDNEEALKRAKNMIAELKRHLSREPKETKEPAERPARRPRKKRTA